MSLRVLLAEDDRDVQFVAQSALRRAGLSVDVANNGREALDAISVSRPDAVVLDWFMPGLDGIEVCRRLKRNPATADLPVVFLTASSQLSDIQQGFAVGARGYLTKPFNALTLGDELKALIA